MSVSLNNCTHSSIDFYKIGYFRVHIHTGVAHLKYNHGICDCSVYPKLHLFSFWIFIHTWWSFLKTSPFVYHIHVHTPFIPQLAPQPDSFWSSVDIMEMHTSLMKANSCWNYSNLCKLFIYFPPFGCTTVNYMSSKVNFLNPVKLPTTSEPDI